MELTYLLILSFDLFVFVPVRTVLLYLSIKLTFEMNAFGENVKGFATRPLFDSPLTKSTTPTEFWTKRWNLMTHTLLKVSRVNIASCFLVYFPC